MKAVQAQMMARGLEFWIWEVDGSYYFCSKNKSTDQLCCNCAFVFAYAKNRFSHDKAQRCCWSSKKCFELFSELDLSGINLFTIKNINTQDKLDTISKPCL